MLGNVVSHLLGLVGAVIGGLLGFFIFRWLVDQGFYGLMIPGAMLGLGCSLLAQHRSLARGVVCGLAAIVLGLYVEWWFRPFKADDGFNYLVLHFFDLKPITQLMIAVGGVFGFWLGKDASPLLSRPGMPRNDQAPKPN